MSTHEVQRGMKHLWSLAGRLAQPDPPVSDSQYERLSARVRRAHPLDRNPDLRNFIDSVLSRGTIQKGDHQRFAKLAGKLSQKEQDAIIATLETVAARGGIDLSALAGFDALIERGERARNRYALRPYLIANLLVGITNLGIFAGSIAAMVFGFRSGNTPAVTLGAMGTILGVAGGHAVHHVTERLGFDETNERERRARYGVSD